MAVRKLQIGEHLRVVNFEERVHGFELNDDQSTNEEIQAIGVIDDQILIGDGTQFLFFEWDAAKTEFVGQGPLISGLQQAGAEFAVNFDTRADDLFGE